MTPAASNLLATHPIESLRQKKPFLFERPVFWKTRLSDFAEFAQQAPEQLEVKVIGKSAGGNVIYAFSHGPKEPQAPTATISSAMASDRPAAFYDPSLRTRPSLVIIGAIHGGETEGVALSMNLLQILATGRDFRGKAQPRLFELLSRVRLTIIPCLNPDGRLAAGVDHLQGAEVEDLFLVQQGLLADGTPFRGRKVKEWQPIPAGLLQFMGGYYNAQGVNLQHDDFFGPRLSPENQAIRALFLDEIPDAFITFHAHGAPPAFLVPDAFLSPGYQRKQVEAAGFISAKLYSQNIKFVPPDRIVTPPWSFYFQTWLYHMTGATPLLFEFCHGLTMEPVSLETILDTGLSVAEGWLEYCLLFGPRPRSNDLFGPPTPA